MSSSIDGLPPGMSPEEVQFLKQVGLQSLVGSRAEPTHSDTGTAKFNDPPQLIWSGTVTLTSQQQKDIPTGRTWGLEVPVPEERLRMLDDRLSADIQFRVGPGKVPMFGHKEVLMTNKYFRDLLEVAEGIALDLPEFDPLVFLEIIKFLYTGQVYIDTVYGYELLSSAMALEIPTLQEYCVRHAYHAGKLWLKHSVADETVAELQSMKRALNELEASEIALDGSSVHAGRVFLVIQDSVVKRAQHQSRASFQAETGTDEDSHFAIQQRISGEMRRKKRHIKLPSTVPTAPPAKPRSRSPVKVAPLRINLLKEIREKPRVLKKVTSRGSEDEQPMTRDKLLGDIRQAAKAFQTSRETKEERRKKQQSLFDELTRDLERIQQKQTLKAQPVSNNPVEEDETEGYLGEVVDTEQNTLPLQRGPGSGRAVEAADIKGLGAQAIWNAVHVEEHLALVQRHSTIAPHLRRELEEMQAQVQRLKTIADKLERKEHEIIVLQQNMFQVSTEMPVLALATELLQNYDAETALRMIEARELEAKQLAEEDANAEEIAKMTASGSSNSSSEEESNTKPRTGKGLVLFKSRSMRENKWLKKREKAKHKEEKRRQKLMAQTFADYAKKYDKPPEELPEVTSNVVVVVRCRPFSETEFRMSSVAGTRDCVSVDGGMTVKVALPIKKDDYLTQRTGNIKEFKFERAFVGPHVTQEDVYEQTGKKGIEQLLNGINSTIFAYGQTGSGKTYTMMGVKENPGIIFLSLRALADAVGEMREGSWEVSILFVEIYNESVYDLLSSDPSIVLDVKESDSGTRIEGVVEARVQDYEDMSRTLSRGMQNRTTRSTNANETSSRSHAVFQVKFTRRFSTGTQSSILSLVDLAGSERAKRTGNTGDKMIESQNINQSLLCLGTCINALAQNRDYVPYRGSKITRLLKESLGGNCRTFMICAISPKHTELEETLNTLNYASEARNIRTKVRRGSVQTWAVESKPGGHGRRKSIAELRKEAPAPSSNTRQRKGSRPTLSRSQTWASEFV